MHKMQTIVTDVCSVCQSVTNALNDLVAASLQARVVCGGHSVQPLTNYFGLLLSFLLHLTDLTDYTPYIVI